VLDAMVQVPDLWSLAAMHALSARLGRRVGGSTGTNLVAALACARALQAAGEQGAIVTLLCDRGELYAHSYHDEAWLAANGLACGAEARAVAELIEHGRWPQALQGAWRLGGELAAAA
jgi:cysteine synthase A